MTHTSPSFFFFNDTATTEIYTLSLHDALPIYWTECPSGSFTTKLRFPFASLPTLAGRSEEHTSELQSQSNLVCRLLLEKKKNGCRPSRATRERPSLSARLGDLPDPPVAQAPSD